MAQATTKPETDQAAAPPARRKKPWLFMLAGALLASTGTAVFFTMQPEVSGKANAATPSHVEVRDPTYLPLKPFLVNFPERGPVRFLQVEMQVLASGPMAVSAMERHMPAIRHEINMLLAAETFDGASSREGKERLREAIGKAIQGILDGQGGGGSVEAVYFTSFVMQ